MPDPTEPEPAERTGVQSVHRALDILEIVVRRSPVGIRPMAEELGLASSTVHGILQTLATRGYVTRTPQGFVLGPRASALSTHWDPSVSLALVTERATQTVAASTGHAATATVLAGASARILAYAPAPGPITVRMHPTGWRHPFALSTGRVLVALGPPERWDSHIATAADIEPGWSARRWRTELTGIRERGVAQRLRRDPRTESSIAVPVLDADGWMICAIGCSCPSFMARDLMVPTVLEALHAAAAQITADLLPSQRPDDHPFPRARTR